MNLRSDIGWNPPHSAYIGDGTIPTWEINEVPDFYRYVDDALDKSQKWQNSATTFTELIKGITGSIPYIGNLFNAVGNIALNAWHRGDVNIANSRRILESRYADWYNSPVQQMKRARKAGINPFMQSYVKSVPHEIPQIETVPNQGFSLNTESLAGLINAFTNAKVAESRIENLDSLTAINEYKENFLYPQLFEANGYANSIAQLQVAWEQKNYEYERILKQQLLETQFGYSLAQLGEKIIELRPQDSKTNLFIDPTNCRVWYVDENGNQVDTTNWKFSDYPIAYQKAWNEVYRMQDLTNANINRIITEANTSSALGALYNANRLKVEQYTTEFEKYGTWPDSDAYLRAAAGAIPWEYINKMQANKLGWSAANAAVGLGVDASKIALNKGLGSYFGKKAIPQTFKLPKGAKPFINADFNSYSTPYNYNFIY